MSDYEFITLFFVTLLVLWPVLGLVLLAFTVSLIVLVSLYRAIRGFISDELDLYYINRRAKEVVEEARDIVRDRVMGVSA